MEKNRLSNRIVLCIIVLFAAVVLTGCAVLTSSQVREVDKFAQASNEYTELPGTLANAYGVLLRNNKLLAVSRYEYGKSDAEGRIDTAKSNKAWDELRRAYEIEKEFNMAGKRMDGALTVLKDYSDILSILVSDDYSSALSESTEKLGESLDSGIDSYNDRFSSEKPMKKVGGLIAQSVRAAGGIYLRHRQIKILRDTLKAADPLISDLMDEIKDIALNQLKLAFDNYERNYLGKEFKSVANNSRRLPVTAIQFVYDDLSRVREASLLSDQIANAAGTYRLAHQRLVEKTRQRMDLKSAIVEIKALNKEIKEARKVKKNIEK